MRKLKLEELWVDSFSTDSAPEHRKGTVMGKQDQITVDDRTCRFCTVGPSSCGQYTCEGFQTQGPGPECLICA